jgi:thiol-disulfide isomerase/thioredoxin
MNNAILIFTTMGLLICALAMTVLLRQIGLISRRMVELGRGGRAPGLEIGTAIPVCQFNLADGSGKLDLSSTGGRPVILLFASLSCGLCRSLLENLRDLDSDVLGSVVLMLLDSGPWKRFSSELDDLGLKAVPVVFAVNYVEEYQITMPPQVYVADGDLKIVEAGRVFTVNELAKFFEKHIGPSDSNALSHKQKEDCLEQ